VASSPTPRAIVEAFLLRSRRVLSHSLNREQATSLSKPHEGLVAYFWVPHQGG